MIQSGSIFRWAFSRVLLSFLAALVGWIATIIFMVLSETIDTVIAKETEQNILALLVTCIVGSGIIYIFWAILFTPISLFVPPQSRFWRIWTLTLIGAICGPILMWLLLYSSYTLAGGEAVNGPLSFSLGDDVLGSFQLAFVGAITGYVAARLNARA